MKISTLILTILVCFSTIVDAQGTQNRANELMKQAQSSLEQKEYTKARYLFIQGLWRFRNAGKLSESRGMRNSGSSSVPS